MVQDPLFQTYDLGDRTIDAYDSVNGGSRLAGAAQAVGGAGLIAAGWFLPKWLQANLIDEYSAIVQIFGLAFVSEFKRLLQSDAPEWKFLKQATIYSTGHSLGSGLAQQFAYALPNDSQVPRVAMSSPLIRRR
ncbi:MAG: putative lipoprotein transrane [Variovorax sp.]|nr:putative lipoprotein transrane [Variovorax sp.]